MGLRKLFGILAIALGWAVAVGASAQTAAIDWSGFHLGGNAGATINDSRTRASVAPGGTYFIGTDFAQVSDAGNGTLSQARPTGGIEAGYSRQYGRLLVGVEAGANALFLDDSRSSSATYLTQPTAQFTLKQSVEADWMATLRARLGFAGDNWLVYVAGGPAVTRVTLETSFSDNFAATASGRDSNAETKLGWTLGLGGEYALNRSWSLKAQYLYADFGWVESSMTVVNPGNGTSVVDNKADFRTHTVLIGVTYRFNSF